MGDHLGRPGAERRDGLLSSSTRGKDKKRGGVGMDSPPPNGEAIPSRSA